MSIQPVIHVVIGSLARGGAERHLSQVLPALAQRGFRFRVVLLSGLGDFVPVIEKAGIDIVPPARRIGNFRIPSALVRLFHFWRLVLMNRKAPFHFFLPESYIFGMTGCLLAFHRGARIMSRRSLNDYQKKHPLAARLERFFHRHITAALGNSRAVVEQLRQEGVPENRLRLIYNGIETERFESARNIRAKLGIAEDALVFSIVANLIPYKGHADLIEALSMAKLPEGWRLICIGRDDGIGTSLRKRAEGAGIADNILWPGSREDVENILASANIGLLASHEEGFSNAILEGMAAGLPMIATDVGGNREALGMDCGIIVPPKDPPALCDAILRLAADAGLRMRMGQAAKARVASEFSLEKCVDAYASFYEEFLPCAD